MDRRHSVRMLNDQSHVHPVSDGVPVRRCSLRAHGGGSNANELRRGKVPDPDEVGDVIVRVLSDDKLSHTSRG